MVIDNIILQLSTPPSGKSCHHNDRASPRGKIDIQNDRIPSGLFNIDSIILNDNIKELL